jgi:hypothetical protein
VLQAAVAQSAQLAVPLAWERARERGVPQAAPRAEQVDQQAAQSVPCASLVAPSGVSLGDLLAVHLEPDEWLAVRSVASLGDLQVVHSAPDELLAVHLVPCELPAVRSVALVGGPQADCSAVRLADDRW